MAGSERSRTWILSRLVHAGLIVTMAGAIGFRVYAYFVAPQFAEKTTVSSASATRQIEVELYQQAKEAWDRRDWSVAAKAYRRLAETSQDDQIWYRYATSLHASEQYDEGLRAYLELVGYPRYRDIALYRLAMVSAVQGEHQSALFYLRQSVLAGFRSRVPLDEIDDFQLLYGDPQFAELVELAKPLRERDQFRRMDFVIGRWDLVDTEARRIGEAELQRGEEGSTILGKFRMDEDDELSTWVFYFDPQVNKWTLVRVDEHGAVFRGLGDLADLRVMMFEGDCVSTGSSVQRWRISFSQRLAGEVAHAVEVSEDDGATWSTQFAGSLLPRTTITQR